MRFLNQCFRMTFPNTALNVIWELRSYLTVFLSEVTKVKQNDVQKLLMRAISKEQLTPKT